MEILLGSWDWECDLSDGSGIFTDTDEVVGVPVVVNLASISLEGGHVAQDVLVCGLVDLHFTLALPVFEPIANNSEVSLSIWAGSHVFVELWKVGHDLLEALEDLLVVLGGEGVGSIAHVLRELLRWLEASLKGGAMVVAGECLDETS